MSRNILTDLDFQGISRIKNLPDPIEPGDAVNKRYADAPAVILEALQVIGQDYTLTAGTNGLSQGPVEIEFGYAVTVPNGSIWRILD